LGRLAGPHEVSAVTGACLVVEKSKFDAVAGFDAEAFPVELGDVDLCLRLGSRGWTALMVPEVTLVHHESATRGRTKRRDKRYQGERERFAARWKQVIRDDPYFHPALSLTSLRTMLEQ
jgi:GT2 family glycosyltransferase